MSEASAGGGKRAEIERTLVQRSLQDEDFRQRLLEDPKAAVEQEFGSRLPESVEVRALQESADTIYLVLPSGSQLGQGEELSDQELEVVAGGAWTGLYKLALRELSLRSLHKKYRCIGPGLCGTSENTYSTHSGE
jgi:hypothetical protein